MEIHNCLTVRQPYADLLTQAVWQDDAGEWHAAKSIEVRSRITRYRGDVLITSSAKPVLFGHEAGVTCGLVELYGTKRVEDFTPEDWERTCIPEGERPSTGWGWLMRNPRRVIELPFKGQLGIFRREMEVTEYPRHLRLGRERWKKILEHVKGTPMPL